MRLDDLDDLNEIIGFLKMIFNYVFMFYQYVFHLKINFHLYLITHVRFCFYIITMVKFNIF